MFVELDGQSYKVVCIEKPRIRLPAQNEIQKIAEPASDAPNETNETSETEHTPAQQQTLTVIPKQLINDSEMERDVFNVAPNQQLFTFTTPLGSESTNSWAQLKQENQTSKRKKSRKYISLEKKVLSLIFSYLQTNYFYV